LEGGLAALVGADSDGLLERDDEDLAVAYLASLGRLDDRLRRLADDVVLYGDLDLHLREEVDRVLAAAVDLGVALLAAETLYFRDGHAIDADLRQGLLSLLQLEWLDDGYNKFHW